MSTTHILCPLKNSNPSEILEIKNFRIFNLWMENNATYKAQTEDTKSYTLTYKKLKKLNKDIEDAIITNLKSASEYVMLAYNCTESEYPSVIGYSEDLYEQSLRNPFYLTYEGSEIYLYKSIELYKFTLKLLYQYKRKQNTLFNYEISV